MGEYGVPAAYIGDWRRHHFQLITVYYVQLANSFSAGVQAGVLFSPTGNPGFAHGSLCIFGSSHTDRPSCDERGCSGTMVTQSPRAESTIKLSKQATKDYFRDF